MLKLFKLLNLIFFFFLCNSLYAQTNGDFFTQEEKDWIKAHPIIHVSPQINLYPYEFISEDGGFDGISNNYIDIVQKQTGLLFVQEIYNNWDESVQAIKAKQTDILPYIYYSKSLEQDLILADSFFEVDCNPPGFSAGHY